MQDTIELPEGRKFFPYSGNLTTDDLFTSLAHLFSAETYKAMYHLNSLSSTAVNYNGMNPSTFGGFLSNVQLQEEVSSEGLPIFKVDAEYLHYTVVGTHTRTSHVLKHTACNIRMVDFSDMPCFKDALISYDPDRRGFILHNAPYEGELVKTKEFTRVNKLIKTSIEDSLAEVAMYQVLGENMKIDDNYYRYKWASIKAKTDSIVDLLTKFLDGDSSWEVSWKLALHTGIGDVETLRVPYVYGNPIPPTHHSSGREFGRYLKIKEGAKVKIPAIARRKLMLQQGAFVLPDNYMEYFD